MDVEGAREKDAAAAAFENPVSDKAAEEEAAGDGNVLQHVNSMTDFEMFAKAPLPEWRLQFKTINDHPVKGVASAVCTLLALFLPDVQELSLAKEWDGAVDVVMTLVMLFFVCEMAVQLCAHHSYYYSLFFWLDVVATVSLIPEVSLLGGMWGAMVGAGEGCAAAAAAAGGSSTTIVRAGRAARAGARAGRLQGLTRVVRLIRVLQLHGAAKKEQVQRLNHEEDAPAAVPEILSAKISFSLARIMIIVVIMSIMFSAVFTYVPEPRWRQTGIDGILETQRAAQTASAVCTSGAIHPDNCSVAIDSMPAAEIAAFMERAESSGAGRLCTLTVDGNLLVDNSTACASLRESEITEICGQGYVAGFDSKRENVEAASGRIWLTLSIVGILVVAGFVLSTEMNGFLSVPMQRLHKSQALSEALLAIFMDSTNPVATLEKSCVKILHCEVVNIYFHDQGADEYYCMRTPQDSTPYHAELRVRSGAGTVGKCGKRGAATLDTFQSLQQLPKDDPSLLADVPKRGKRAAFRWSARSVMCYPLQFQVGASWECVGVLQAINKKPEAKPAVSVLEIVKHVLGLASTEDEGFDSFDNEVAQMFANEAAQILKGFRMDAMYANMFADSGEEAEELQALLTQFATSDVVQAAAAKSKEGPDLKFMFDLYDTDKSGDLDRSEVKALAAEMGKSLTEEELDAAMSEMDGDGQGTVCFAEFSSWWDSSSSSDLQLAIETKYQTGAATSISRLLSGVQGLPELSELRQWGAPCLDYTHDQLCGAALMMLTDSELGFCVQLDIAPEVFMKFITRLLGKCYHSVPYHNAFHAFSVLQGTYYLVTSTELCRKFSAIEKLAVMVAAIGHDAGHDGVNTTFHVERNSDLAHLYNDKSPLENMHARETFSAMRESGCNVLASLKPTEMKLTRKLIIESIISTDMAFHKHHVDELAAKHEIKMEIVEDREMLMGLMVHLVDVGASAYSWTEAPRWSRMVMTEFQAQVEQERDHDMPVSAFMDLGEGDEVAGKFAQSQVGFIGFVLLPFFQLFPPHIPELTDAYQTLKDNRQAWVDVKEGRKAMPPPVPADDEKLGWSVNVGHKSADDEKLATAKVTTKLGTRAFGGLC